MRKTIILSFILLAASCLLSIDSNVEARRFSTSAYILSNVDAREYGACNDFPIYSGGIQSNTGVIAVSYNWTISGNGAYISGSTTTNSPNVVNTRDYSEKTSYQICVSILGSDNNYYSKCRTVHLDPERNCFLNDGGGGIPN